MTEQMTLPLEKAHLDPDEMLVIEHFPCTIRSSIPYWGHWAQVPARRLEEIWDKTKKSYNTNHFRARVLRTDEIIRTGRGGKTFR